MESTQIRDPNVFFPSLTQLRAFAEAARLGSISRASEELRRSQSAVTQAVQNLEIELGVTLFTRTNTGSYLTDMGKILQRRAEGCFSRINNGVQEIVNGSQKKGSAAAVSRRITKAQILALTSVHESTSFAQAARHAKVSLTSLHRSARSLEQQIGVKLFKNTAQGAATSEAGTKLSNHLLLAMRELEWAEEEIKSQKGVLRGRLLIGALMLAGTHFIAVGLDKFISEHPEVKISIINGTYDVLLSKLRGGSIDFLVGLMKNPPPTDDVVEEPLVHDPYVIAVSRDHPLARRDRVTVADLSAGEWIAPPARRLAIEGIFKGYAMPRFNVETHSLPAIFILLADANRMSLLTRSELALDQRLGNNLAALKFSVPGPAAVMGVTVRKQWEPTRLQCTFLSFLRAQTAAQSSR